MSAITIDLLTACAVFDEATIQSRTQDIIATVWPAWKRERAIRLAIVGDMTQLLALNDYLAKISAEVDTSRANCELLEQTLKVEAAETVLALPEAPEEVKAAALVIFNGASETAKKLAADRKAARAAAA